MSKVAEYLQSHLLGELYTRMDVREAYARDGSVLEQRPELVVLPRNTNDVRKVARFAWQLAQKGHAMPLTACGSGTDQAGASISKGAIIDLSKYMDGIYEYDAKQKLLRLQPGALAASVQSALRLHGTILPAIDDTTNETIGGAIGNDSASHLSGSFGTMMDWTSQLEVVLDTGDVIQTGRLSRREVNKLMGSQGRVGDIYRGIDTVLEDHKELLERYAKADVTDRAGYPGVFRVLGKGGSIDLTPLFVGSQGTLGIVVEAIVKTEFVPINPQAVALFFPSAENARDAADALAATNPSVLEYYDGRFFSEAVAQGKTFAWASGLEGGKYGAVVWVSYLSFQQRLLKKNFKKVAKLAEQYKAVVVSSFDHDYESLLSLRSIVDYIDTPSAHADKGSVLLGHGMYVPAERFEAFVGGIAELEKKLHLQLPLDGSLLASIYRVHPSLSMRRVSDKQKIFKLLDELTKLLAACEGSLVGAGGEGRLLGKFAYSAWDEEYAAMMQEIKAVFDPHSILNPGVKQSHELKTLVGILGGDNPRRK